MICLQQQYTDSKKGFTLVETLVAISILLVAIVGPLTMVSRSLQSVFFAREQLTASYLAQEGVELIRATRDGNALAGRAWLSGLSECQEPSGCGVEARSSTFVDCDDPVHYCRLNYDSTALGSNRGAYTYTATGRQSPFTRIVYVTETVANVEAQVTVTVSWPTGLLAGGAKTVTFQSRIFNEYAP